MTQKTILIVGAGVGGLSAGCYAAMNGYRATILEMHARPGGVCTSWTRAGYVFDGCIHNLAGTSRDSRLHAMWRELGVVPRLEMQGYDELVSVERPDGPPLRLYTDLERLEAHLKALSPADAPLVDELIAAARWFQGFDLLGLALAPPAERLAALARGAPMFLKWGAQTLDSYARKFKDPFLRRAFPTIVYDWPGQTMLMALYFLGRSSIGDLGWPRGGAQAFSQAIADRFTALGGEIRYGAKVQTVLVEHDRAVGVRLTDGSELRADVVICNGYGPEVIFGMLGGRYASRAIRSYYARPEDRIEMGVHVSLGVARDLSGEPHAIVLPLEAPTRVDAELRERLYVECFGFDASLAPAGKSPLKVVLATSYGRWEQLARDHGAYKGAQARIAETVVAQLERRFPGLREQVEVVDVATPISTLRFTGNGHGFKADPNGLLRALFTGRRLSQTLPGLAGFYMVGQWAGPPSLPLVAAMGRDVVRQICRRDGRPFVADPGGSTLPIAA